MIGNFILTFRERGNSKWEREGSIPHEGPRRLVLTDLFHQPPRACPSILPEAKFSFVPAARLGIRTETAGPGSRQPMRGCPGECPQDILGCPLWFQEVPRREDMRVALSIVLFPCPRSSFSHRHGRSVRRFPVHPRFAQRHLVRYVLLSLQTPLSLHFVRNRVL